MTVHDICQLAYKYKSIFPGVYKSYKLLLTVPVTVAIVIFYRTRSLGCYDYINL